jgi:prepilin-type N-terminal cleavage/methylation domain-containing protein
MNRSSQTQRSGFTLLELVVVMTVLAVLAGLVLLHMGAFQIQASDQATEITLDVVRDAILGTSAGQGYQQDMKTFDAGQAISWLPSTLASLYNAPAGSAAYDPVTHFGWHGPYLNPTAGTYKVNIADGFTADYGATGDPTPVDAWNHPIVIQIPSSDPTYARLVSAGQDGIIQTPLNYLDANGKPYPPKSMRGDDVVLFLLRPDVPSTP